MSNNLTTIEEIESWLKNNKIFDYDLIPNEEYGYVINVYEDVILFDKGLDFIPVKFNIVTGNFVCSRNKLTNLDFCPSEVGKGFHCSMNQLTSLDGAPKYVASDFDCAGNKLTTLKGCPTNIYGNFFCESNQLTSLEFSPEVVNGDFNCNHNKLLNLQNSPQTVKGYFDCSYNELETLSDIKNTTMSCTSFYIYGNEKLSYLFNIKSTSIKNILQAEQEHLQKNSENKTNHYKNKP